MILMGPPGAGKGTQAKAVAATHDIPAISTGDIFRANVKDSTELGKKAQEYMDAGKYVPDEITNSMVADRLAEPDAKAGFLLDGYPRTEAQVAELDSMLAEQGASLDAAVVLEVDEDELVARLMQRAENEGRSDDSEEVVRERMAVYKAETAPLMDIYEQRGLLCRVDGMGSVDEVRERISAALES
ncbi:adenylate kinase [Nocardioidaceae bacterium]|nr:adenylate kinase [Nocardioidaceae bacterium]